MGKKLILVYGREHRLAVGQARTEKMTIQVPGEVISLPGPQPPDFQVAGLGRKAHIT